MKILRVLMMVIIISFSICAKEPLKSYKEGQKLYVWAINGMNFREEPKPDGKIISLLPYGAEIEVMKQSSKIEYIYNFQVPKKYKDNEQITLNGYWLKIKVGDKVGYIFDKLCLTYKPYLAVKIYNEQYLINYLVKNLKIQLVNDEIEVKKESDSSNDYYYSIYKQSYLSKESKNQLSIYDSNGYAYNTVRNSGSVIIENMSFQEALVFFLVLFQPSEKDFYYTYKDGKELTYELNEIPNNATISKLQNSVKFEWDYLAD